MPLWLYTSTRRALPELRILQGKNMIEVIEWPVGTKLVRICGCGAVLQFDQSDIDRVDQSRDGLGLKLWQTVDCPSCGKCAIVGETL